MSYTIFDKPEPGQYILVTVRNHFYQHMRTGGTVFLYSRRDRPDSKKRTQRKWNQVLSTSQLTVLPAKEPMAACYELRIRRPIL